MSRPVKAIAALELSSRCNLHCPWCAHGPSGAMKRPKQDMPEAVFVESLGLIRHFVKAGTQGRVQLECTGESTLHPRLGEYALRTRVVIGTERGLYLTTNGLLVDEQLCRLLAAAAVEVCLSLYRDGEPGLDGTLAVKQKQASQMLERHGILRQRTNQPLATPMNWAGQVDWPDHGGPVCPWLACGEVVVFSDGRIGPCGFDAAGVGILGRVGDAPETLHVRETPLCRKCCQWVPGLVPRDGAG